MNIWSSLEFPAVKCFWNFPFHSIISVNFSKYFEILSFCILMIVFCRVSKQMRLSVSTVVINDPFRNSSWSFANIVIYTINFRTFTMRYNVILVLKIWSFIWKLVSAIFISFLFFHQMITLQKLWSVFYFIKKALFVLQIFKVLYFFPLLFHTFQIEKDKWKWNNMWCHEVTCINLQMQFLK